MHTGVADLGAYTREADILVAAAGLARSHHARHGEAGRCSRRRRCVVRGPKPCSTSDDVAEVAGWLSPRIGGVGPMTRAMLLVNTVEAAERRVAGRAGRWLVRP